MFRNQYDSDAATWSPQGRIFQVEYAQEAVKQGACALGLKSDKYVVLAAVKRAPSELASHQEKIFEIDRHVGCTAAGLMSDGRLLVKKMRNECLNHHYVYETPMSIEELIRHISDKAQSNTQRDGQRPYGVGLLLGGVDRAGAHLFEFSPNGYYLAYKAMAIGARAQSAKTYLEKNLDNFKTSSLDELIQHALSALKDASQDKELTVDGTALAFVGVDREWKQLEGEELLPHIRKAMGVE